jgi:hypothetical protein
MKISLTGKHNSKSLSALNSNNQYMYKCTSIPVRKKLTKNKCIRPIFDLLMFNISITVHFPIIKHKYRISILILMKTERRSILFYI